MYSLTRWPRRRALTRIEDLERRLLQSAQYTLTLLPPAAGYSASAANAINASGVVAGASSRTGAQIGTIWHATSASTVTPPAGAATSVLDINGGGDVVIGSYKRSAAGTFTLLRDSAGRVASGEFIND